MFSTFIFLPVVAQDKFVAGRNRSSKAAENKKYVKDGVSRILYADAPVSD